MPLYHRLTKARGDAVAKVFSRINRNAEVFNRVVTGSSVDLVNRILQSTYNSATQRTSIISKNDHTIRPEGHKRLKDHDTLNLATPSTMTGRGNIRGDVGNSAPHARWVHEGRGPISNKWMVWENSGGRWPGRHVQREVAAADAQPWLVLAYNNAVSTHPETSTIAPMSTTRPRF